MPFLYETVDFLYHIMMETMPQFLQDRPLFCAPALGASGSYGLVRGMQYVSRNFMRYVIDDFDEVWLPRLEKACMALTAAVPFAYAYSDPQGAMEVMTQNPVYSAGMGAAIAGAMAGAAQDLHRRSVEDARNPSREAVLLNGVKVPLEELAGE